jgi:hypothetical protein
MSQIAAILMLAIELLETVWGRGSDLIVYLIAAFRSSAVAICRYAKLHITPRSRESSVGIATRYGLDGSRIESRWGRYLTHPSKPALGPTQPPIQCVPGLSRG